MNLKILFMLIAYYSAISLFFSFGSGYADSTYNVTNPLNDSDMADTELDTGGLFASGVSFLRFLGFVTIGIGLPADTPIWFATIFSTWQIMVLIFSIGFIISSIWDG